MLKCNSEPAFKTLRITQIALYPAATKSLSWPMLSVAHRDGK